MCKRGRDRESKMGIVVACVPMMCAGGVRIKRKDRKWKERGWKGMGPRQRQHTDERGCVGVCDGWDAQDMSLKSLTAGSGGLMMMEPHQSRSCLENALGCCCCCCSCHAHF